MGKVIAMHIDPVEKKPVYHFLPTTPIYSIGTIGCNFRCAFCQNYDISQAPRLSGRGQNGDVEDLDYGRPLPPEEIVSQCVQQGIKSIAFTYNEPAIFHEYAVAVMKLARPHGIKSVFVTNGYETPEALRMLRPWIDVMRVDLKSFRAEFYERHCGAKLEHVLKTIQLAKQLGYWVEVVTLLIPGENDSDEEIRQMAQFVVSVDPNIPHHWTAFHPDYKMLDKERTPAATCLRAHDIAISCGEKFVYVGNITDRDYGSTYCPQCHAVLIERRGLRSAAIRALDSARGVCAQCGTNIPGIWK